MKKRQLVIRHQKQTLRSRFWQAHEALSMLLSEWSMAHLPRMRRRPIEKIKTPENITHSLAFTCSLVALHARLARFKGHLSADAFLEFRCLFPVGDAESKNLRTLFKLAWDDDETISSHANRMKHCYKGRNDLCISVLEGLARHMLADGKPNKAQLAWLNEVAQEFEINRLQMRQIIWRAEQPLEARPHALLKLPKRASESQIKMAYRSFMQRCHPDHNQHTRLPETKLASERLSRAGNLAYKRLKK